MRIGRTLEVALLASSRRGREQVVFEGHVVLYRVGSAASAKGAVA